MTKRRTGDPWMPAPSYAAGLSGLGVNLVVADIDRALAFQTEVLGARPVYADPDFAAVRFEHAGNIAEWMLHAVHTYDAHPWYAALTEPGGRGLGIELRLHGRDPDLAAQRALAHGYRILQAPTDKPHGLREAYLQDPDGYVWVTDVPLPAR